MSIVRKCCNPAFFHLVAASSPLGLQEAQDAGDEPRPLSDGPHMTNPFFFLFRSLLAVAERGNTGHIMTSKTRQPKKQKRRCADTSRKYCGSVFFTGVELDTSNANHPSQAPFERWPFDRERAPVEAAAFGPALGSRRAQIGQAQAEASHRPGGWRW